MAEFGRTASFSRPGLQLENAAMDTDLKSKSTRGINMTKGGIRLVYVWAHCDGHIFARYIEINCLDQRNLTFNWLRCRSTMTACNDRRRRWVDSRSVVRLVEQVLLHEQEMCFLRRAATVEMGNDRCVGVISQTTKTSKHKGNVRREILSWIFCVRYSVCTMK